MKYDESVKSEYTPIDAPQTKSGEIDFNESIDKHPATSDISDDLSDCALTDPNIGPFI